MRKLYLDNRRMHTEVLRRLNAINKPQIYLCRRLNIGRSTLWRLGNGDCITVETFLKIVSWLDEDVSKYIKYEDERKNRTRRGY